METTKRHRAEIIEVYENGARAAAKFASGRVECVCRRGMTPAFEIGQRGWAAYTRCLNGYEWTFEPFKSQVSVD